MKKFIKLKTGEGVTLFVNEEHISQIEVCENRSIIKLNVPKKVIVEKRNGGLFEHRNYYYKEIEVTELPLELRQLMYE